MSTISTGDSNSGEIKFTKGNTSSSYIYPGYGEYWYTPPDTRVTWVSPSPRCAYCDGLGHSKKPELCPRVKSISYFKDGTISKIEFHKIDE